MGDADPEPAGQSLPPWAELQAQQVLLTRLGRDRASPGDPRPDPVPGVLRWPADVTAAPLVIDTDIGSDPDDAVALAVAARGLAELALVTTGDETGPRAGGYGQRARAARWLLDACGRPEIPVAPGAALDDIAHFVLAGAIPDQVPAAAGDIVSAVAALAARVAGPLRWVGIAPMTNLARVITEAPEIAARLHVTQMGTAIHYRHPERAEHNVRLDPAAARTVLDAAHARRLGALELVTSDVTFTEAIALHPEHPICRQLAGDRAPWARMLHTSLHRWFTHPRGYRHTMQHDALTLTAALELPFVESIPTQVTLDPIGRLVHPAERTEGPSAPGDASTPPGTPGDVLVSGRADYPSFMRWLERGLSTRETPTRPGPGPGSAQAADPAGTAGAAR